MSSPYLKRTTRPFRRCSNCKMVPRGVLMLRWTFRDWEILRRIRAWTWMMERMTKWRWRMVMQTVRPLNSSKRFWPCWKREIILKRGHPNSRKRSSYTCSLRPQFNMAGIHFSWLEVQVLLLFIWSLTQFCLLFAWLQKILFMVFFHMVEFEHWFQDVNSPLY